MVENILSEYFNFYYFISSSLVPCVGAVARRAARFTQSDRRHITVAGTLADEWLARARVLAFATHSHMRTPNTANSMNGLLIIRVDRSTCCKVEKCSPQRRSWGVLKRLWLQHSFISWIYESYEFGMNRLTMGAVMSTWGQWTRNNCIFIGRWYFSLRISSGFSVSYGDRTTLLLVCVSHTSHTNTVYGHHIVYVQCFIISE